MLSWTGNSVDDCRSPLRRPRRASIGIVDATAAEGAVAHAAVDLLRPLSGKNQETLGAIKQTMFAQAVDALKGGIK
jgi:hypothetical protein